MSKTDQHKMEQLEHKISRLEDIIAEQNYHLLFADSCYLLHLDGNGDDDD